MPTSSLNARRTAAHLNAFDWHGLFFDELGWNEPISTTRPVIEIDDRSFDLQPIAEQGGVSVYEVEASDDTIPNASTRLAVHRKVEEHAREHILIFVGLDRRQTIWSYPVYDGSRLKGARPHHFVKGQPADLFISKLAGIFFDMEDLDDDGNASLAEAQRRVRQALDVEQVTKGFYAKFKGIQESLAGDRIAGIDGDRTRRHYASVFLTRLMFIYFLQKKGFLDRGNRNYLREKLDEHRAGEHEESFYRRFLRPLFFEGFAQRPAERSARIRALLGEIRYLNGGLFLEHAIEQEHDDLDVADEAIEEVLGLFDEYTWHLDDTPGGEADEINPDVLGYILEKYVNQKAFGAYYTPPELTGYICDATIDRLLVDELSDPEGAAVAGIEPQQFDSLGDLLSNLDDARAVALLERLESLSVLDPACGSGAFLVAALKKLLVPYGALLGHAKLSKNGRLKKWIAEAESHPSTGYFLKKQIITRNLFGVDLMPEAVEIARLRLFLALVASAEKEEDLEPLPNIDFNLLAGNSLIGLLKVEEGHLPDMFAAQDFQRELDAKNRLVEEYRSGLQQIDRDDTTGALLDVRNRIDAARRKAGFLLDDAVRIEMHNTGVSVKEATWTGKKLAYKKRGVATDDVSALTPFHWAYEFSEIMERGGFDVVLANPPWDKLKPDDKEFFEQYSDAVSKNRMRIEDFKKHKAGFLKKNREVVDDYERYMTSFGHQSLWFRNAREYAHQISEVNGRKQGSDLNLYKLFLERVYRLLRPKGQCGIVIPSGVYTDLGGKGLRKMLFEETTVTGLFCFENSGGIFEDVHRQYKFILLSFKNSGTTDRFPAAFMRHDPSELARFPEEGSVEVVVEDVKVASPSAWSVPEFTGNRSKSIFLKMLEQPQLSVVGDGGSEFRLGNEFHMTGDSDLFRSKAGSGRIPLWEGKLIHQFDPHYDKPTRWIEEKEGFQRLSERRTWSEEDANNFRNYRLGHRSVASSTNERSMIATILPRNVFFGHSINALRRGVKIEEQLYFCALLNSFVVDYSIRQRVSANLTMNFIYETPAPRLKHNHPAFDHLSHLSARLTCTTPDFDDLAAEVGLGDHTAGATDPEERAAIRAEIDGRVAHLYGLTEEEFHHILFHDAITGFHRVPDGVREDAMAAYRALAPHPDTALVEHMIADGESELVEFKETFAVDNETGEKHKGVLHSALKTVCGFLNSSGGTLLLGVDDDGGVQGLEKDYARCSANNQNADGLENKIVTLLRDRLSPPPSFGHVAITFHTIEGREICRVLVSPIDTPTRLDGDFFVRHGNSTRKLSADEADRWQRLRSQSEVVEKSGAPTTTSSTTKATATASPPTASRAPKQAPDATRAPNESTPSADDESADDPPDATELDPEELLALVRGILTEVPDGYERDDLLREISRDLGYQRLGSRIRSVLDGAVRSAVMRGICYRDDEGYYVLDCRSITDYSREDLDRWTLSAVGSVWTPRDRVPLLVARTLGYRRTGSTIRREVEKAVKRLIRRGEMESEGGEVRRG